MATGSRKTNDLTAGNTQILNAECENELVIVGYRKSTLKTILTWMTTILSGGLIFILLNWKESISLKAKYKPCSLQNAEKILVKDEHSRYFVEKIKHGIVGSKKKRITYFENKKLKYVWNEEEKCFDRLRGLDYNTRCGYFYANSAGLDFETANDRVDYYGPNSITVEVKSFFYLLFYEALNPFYIFQVYTIIVWVIQSYYYFACGIFILSSISISVTVIETRKQSQVLHNTVQTESIISALRNNTEVNMSSTKLVPGDVITIPKRDYSLECDAVLINGQCTVDESMLSGESVPITKTTVPTDSQELFSVDLHRRHILFAGTRIVQTRNGGNEKVKAVVIRTGFSTTKGELVRSILFPKPLDLKFYTDFAKFFVVFLILGVIAATYSAVMWTLSNATVFEAIFNSLDIITFVIPPVLPAAYTSALAFAQRHLKKHGIFCLSSKYINMCGGLDVVCFDKTGTLTEDDIDVKAVLPVKDGRFDSALVDPTYLPIESSLLHAMATCHNLTIIDDKLFGYPLDIKIFKAINWTFF